MSFWDELSKGVTDAANFTVKKTNELTNAAKLRINLRMEEAKLSKCFEEIGRIYYSFKKTGAGSPADIAALFDEADEIKINIAVIKQEIAKAKNSKICVNCGAELNVKAAYCMDCGAKQEKEDECCCGCGCEDESCCCNEDCCTEEDCADDCCCEDEETPEA